MEYHIDPMTAELNSLAHGSVLLKMPSEPLDETEMYIPICDRNLVSYKRINEQQHPTLFYLATKNPNISFIAPKPL
jgi:hypothetical protein